MLYEGSAGGETGEVGSKGMKLSDCEMSRRFVEDISLGNDEGRRDQEGGARSAGDGLPDASTSKAWVGIFGGVSLIKGLKG